MAVVSIAACSSGGGTPAAPYTSAGDQQCRIAYQVSGSTVNFTVTSTVAGQLSYSVVGSASGADAGTTVKVGTNPFQEKNIIGFRRITGNVTASDKTVYHCSVAPAPKS
jgi:hypothetical protein